MAIRSLFPNLRRINIAYSPSSRRLFSSRTFPGHFSDESSEAPYNDHGNDLKGSLVSGILSSRRSATAVLQNWVDEGRRVSRYELRRISRQLMIISRYRHALEIVTWMENQDKFRMSPSDHALRLELIIKVHGSREAEQYFANIQETASQKAAALPLLHSYVKQKAIDKAEALMVKINQLGLAVSPHPFNEMMKLYAATSQFEKAISMIHQMNRNKIPKNVLSYNLWMNSCWEVSGVESAEMVYREMVNDVTIEVGWSSLSTLANIYIKAGLLDKANLALESAENKLSTRNRLGYFFLITLYSSLNNRDGVLRLWEASKEVEGRSTCANYMCILSCLVKLGDIEEAEKIFKEWESCPAKYDIRVSNVLLGAYMRNGLMEKGEAFHHYTLARGGCPNYKTWEILMEGWVKIKSMDKAIDAMKKGFSMLKHCDWRPSPGIVVAIAEYFEKSRNYEDAKRYLKDVRRLGVASLEVYKPLLRMHAHDLRPMLDIVKMMEKDGIVMDDETLTIVQDLNL